MKPVFFLMLIIVFQAACDENNITYDASGTFETDEVIISSEITGKINTFSVQEGAKLLRNDLVGTIDSKSLILQKEQVQASLSALQKKTSNVQPQVQLLYNQLTVQQSQLNHLLGERTRYENLIKANAATGKQLDDINAQIDVSEKQMLLTRQQVVVQKNNTSTQNQGILSEDQPLQRRIAQLDDQIQRANIVNPITGTVISKYAEAGEMTGVGKPLYKIADLTNMTLRAYITGSQLSQVKLGQQVNVMVDDGHDKYKNYNGALMWISDKAEFTPKTIQTKEERANLVYATKIKVKNDGYLKIGMYGEVKFQ